MKDLIKDLREYDADYPAFELMDKAANAIELLLSETNNEICTYDAAHDLRARLAKYEDAEGRPVVAGDCAGLIGGLRELAGHSFSHEYRLIVAAADSLESQAREIERLKERGDVNAERANRLAEQLAALKAQQPSGVVLPERQMYTAYLSGVVPSNAVEVNSYRDGWNACLDEVERLNKK